MESRSFWPGEITRSTSGISLDQFFCLLIELARPALRSIDPRTNLRNLGTQLQSWSASSPDDFGALALGAARKMQADCADALLERTADQKYSSTPWAADVRTFVEMSARAALRPEFWIPLDLQYGRETKAAAATTQALTHQFGQLLYYWPDISEAMFAAARKTPLTSPLQLNPV
jgi:hypothetical protein